MFRPMAAGGRARSTRGNLAVRRKSASAAVPIPGAIAGSHMAPSGRAGSCSGQVFPLDAVDHPKTEEVGEKEELLSSALQPSLWMTMICPRPMIPHRGNDLDKPELQLAVVLVSSLSAPWYYPALSLASTRP